MLREATSQGPTQALANVTFPGDEKGGLPRVTAELPWGVQRADKLSLEMFGVILTHHPPAAGREGTGLSHSCLTKAWSPQWIYTAPTPGMLGKGCCRVADRAGGIQDSGFR